MLIPEYKKEASTAQLVNLTELDQYKKIRAATTDKVICVLFVADWDDSSKVLKEMVEARVAQNISANTMLFNWVDCDAGEDLVEHFDIESVPSLAIVLPHKQEPQILAGVTPEQLTDKLTEMDSFIKTLFEQEKQLAFREIEDLVRTNPFMMFIKGTLDAPKCKFTRRLVETLKPKGYRNIKTFDILGDERIRQWLKFYTQWPTFPQVYVNGEFQGGLDVVCELIEEGEFDGMLPAQCKKLSPLEALKELLQANQVIVFKSEADSAQSDKLVGLLDQLQATYALVHLSANDQFKAALTENAEEMGYRGLDKTQIYIGGRNQAQIEELCNVAEGSPVEQSALAQLLPASCIKETLDQRLQKLVKLSPIMLFMKGCPDSPQCQFSTKIVGLLNKYVGTVIPSFGYFDIFQDEEVRQGMKEFSKWPTFPQLYVNGNFVGGLDICIELDEEGELEDALTAGSK